MRRADRLFDISQTLRSAPHSLTASAIAEKREVTIAAPGEQHASLMSREV